MRDERRGAERKVGGGGLSAAKQALLERVARGSMRVAKAPARMPTSTITTPSTRQRQMWLVEQLKKGSSLHNQAFAVLITGPCDAGVLEAAIQDVFKKHETLRSGFEKRQELPVVRLFADVSPALPVTDVHDEEDVVRALKSDIEVPFELVRPPLLRAHLYRLSEHRHYLTFVVHHIVFDGWSAGVLATDVAQRYGSLRSGIAGDWETLPWQYSDFTTWQEGLPHADALDFWRRSLADVSNPVGFASANATTGSGFERGLHRGLVLPQVHRNLLAWCRAEQVSPFAAMLTAFQALLYRVTGQDDVIVGSPFANRANAEVEAMIGPCFNVFPMRASFEGRPSFVSQARTTHVLARRVSAIESVPFEALDPDALGSGAAAAQMPLWFGLHNFPLREVSVGGVTFEPALLDTAMHNGGTRLELGVAFVETPKSLFGMWDFDSEKFSLGEVTELARKYEALLAAVLASPGRPLDEIPFDDARTAVTRASGAPGAMLVRIDQQVDKRRQGEPERIAIEAPDSTYSLAQLGLLSDQIAAALRERGLGRGALVGICMSRSGELIAAMLGVWKAGAAYLPIDPAQPLARTALILDDAQVALMLVDESTVGVPNNGSFEKLSVECIKETEAPPVHLTETAHVIDDLAYVLYTSGSTGHPKGVEITHRALSNFIASMAERPGLAAEDTLVAVTTVSFDISGLEIWLPLTTGARLVLASSETAADGTALAALLRDTNATVLQATPSSWRMLLDAGWNGSIKMLSGGEALPQPLARRLVGLGGELWNLYGPTETTIWSSAARIDEQCNITLGEPIAATSLHVLDSLMRPVGNGVAGELYIGGVGLARGYRRRPSLTAERFVPDPFGEDGSRLYRTGDVVRARLDGTLEFIGRVDQQVKIRGHRVELGEVEAALLTTPGVSAAAVVTDVDPHGDARMVAFLAESEVSRREQAAELVAEHRAAWERVWEETYGERSRDAVDPQFDVSGWRSSYTGLAIPAQEMREWVDLSVANVMEEKPRRVLEIGCGTGLLALRIAPHCEDYLATDASPAVLEQLNRCKGELRIRTQRHFATELQGIPARSFDTVILNSVIQYLSSEDELNGVLEHAIRATAPGGVVYVGDVRDLALLDAFYASWELSAQPHLSKSRLGERIARRRAMERELVVHAEYFHRLRARFPHLGVEVRPKRGFAVNEVTRFRFDVLLRVSGDKPEPGDAAVAVRDWVTEGMALENLVRELESTGARSVSFVNIPNARVVNDPLLAAFCTDDFAVASNPGANGRRSSVAVDPEALRAAASKVGFRVALEVTRGQRGGTFGACCFSPASACSSRERLGRPRYAGDTTGIRLTNNPLGLAVERSLIARARAVVETSLPSHMMPARFVALVELPATPNGKIDRKALRSACTNVVEESDYVAPRTETEMRAASIWATVLGVEQVGVDDDFFHLGGNSLLGIRVLYRVTKMFARELSMRDLFEGRTLRAFAARIEEASTITETSPCAPASSHTLSFGQERLLFLDQLDPGSWTYNMPAAVQIDGPLDVGQLEHALTQLIRRHKVLATSFSMEGERPEVRVHEVTVALERIDLQGLSEDERNERAEVIGREEARRPFDLTSSPQIRATLLRKAEQSHVLLLTVHHIAADGWSIDILLRDLTAFWGSAGDVAGAQLPPLRMQYADFAAWQRHSLSGSRLSEGLSFWKAFLEGYPYQLLLPTDRPRPVRPSNRGRRFPFALPMTILSRLRRLAAQEDTTLFMTLLAGLGVLLGRYSGEPKVLIGTAFANRPLAEVEDLIGFFVNSLAMPVDLSHNPTIGELLGRVHKTSVDAFAHGAIPFEKVVDEVLPARDLSRHPIFQVLLILQSEPQVEIEVADLRLKVVELDPEISRFDLGLSVYETADGLKGFVEYATDLFDEATIGMMVSHLERVLDWMGEHADARLSELPMLSASEEQRILRDWNDSKMAYAGEQCIQEVVEAQCQRTPARIAVESEGRQLTYAELDRQSNKLGHYLRELGVGPEVLVGICVDRSVDMFVGVLAILKAGGAFVPLDTNYPMDRLNFMLNDSGAKVVVTRDRTLGDVSVQGIVEVRLDEGVDGIATQPESPLPLRSVPTNLAYVIYTSGSTGRPKGVGCPHTGVVNLLAEVATWVPLAEGFRGGQWTSLSFDASIYEIFSVLAFGGVLCAVPEHVRADGTMLLDWVEEERIASAYLPPHVLPELAIRAERVGATFPLRRLLIGIEPIPEELLARMRRAVPGLEIVNAYGPTETTVMATRHMVVRDDAVGQTPIGTPIANTSTYVLSGDMRAVPVGVVGELWLGGEGQTRGYLNRPALTAERFVPNPFGEDGSRLYRTGDLVRWLKNGALEFVGRADHQIKLRGFRVELGEIEAVLAAQEGVRAGAVVVRDDDRGQKRIVAYVVGEALDRTVLRASLGERLPEHMVPSLFVMLDELPQTPSGKIDRRALPAPSWKGPSERSVPPRTEAESKLVDVWSAVLQEAWIGITDNFFELGGDSIIAIQVVSRARLVGVQITPRDLFTFQTIEMLARHAAQQQAVVVAQQVVEGAVTPTPIVARFLDEAVLDRAHFNQAVMLEFAEPVDVDALTDVLSTLVAHHDALRMRLRSKQDAGWELEIAAVEEHCYLERIEVSDGEFASVCQRVQTSLNLEDGPLLRAALLDEGAGAQRLLMVIHHLAVDAVSWRILLEDLARGYCARLEGRSVEFGDKTTSYQEWATRLASIATAPEAEASLGLGYWTELASVVGTSLPTDFEGGSNRVGDVEVLSVALDEVTTSAIVSEAPKAFRTRVNEVLLAGVARAFGEWTGADNLVLELEGHGREDIVEGADLSRTVGWFTSIFPVSLPGAGTSVSDTLRAVKETLRNVPRNGVGYGLLRYLGRDDVRASLSSSWQPEVSFNYLGQMDRVVDGPFKLADPQVAQVRGERSQRAHVLEIESHIRHGRLHMAVHYSRALHHRKTIEAVAMGIVRELSALVDRCRSGATLAYSPADFPLARLSQERLDALVGGAPVDGLYPLSPLQEGMLFHEVLDPTIRVYCEQLVVTLGGRLQLDKLRRAWELLAERHTILRTVFYWHTEGRPLQLVRPSLALDWCELDLGGRYDEGRVKRYLRDDQERGFELDKSPPWRVALMMIQEDKHVLVFTHHHLLLDGWSYNLLFRNLLELYTALVHGDAPPLLPVDNYERFIAWLESRDRTGAAAFWRDVLYDTFTPTLLAESLVSKRSSYTDRDGAAGHGEYTTELSSATTAALERLSRSRQLTLSGLVASAWAILLSRYLDQDDVLFGVTESGRPTELVDVEQAMGLFINTVPLRVQLDEQESVEELARRVIGRSLEARDYGWYPLPDIQACSDVPQGTPLFDTIVVFENYPVDRAIFDSSSELQLQDVQLFESTTYPIALYALPGETLRLRFNYLGSVDDQLIAQLGSQLAHVLDQMVREPDRAVGYVDVIRPSDAREIATWNATGVDVEPTTVDVLFEAAVREAPDSVAIAFRDQKMTFRELDEAAEKVAATLLARGAGPDVLVGLSVHRSLEMVVALFGILKAGAAYLPLDPTYPAQRISYLLSDASVSLVLTERSLLPRLASCGACVLDIEGVLAERVSSAAEVARRKATRRATAHPDQLAYVIYTSGSTGKPKGVNVTHGNVANFFAGMDGALSRDEQRVWLAVTSISFDISVLELLWTLCVGNMVVVQEPDYVAPTQRGERPKPKKPVEFSLFYFANASGETASPHGRYRLLTEGARFADTHGFSAVWTPERHFHAFGGLYPNPSVTSAALATITKRVALRAGSVVLPLHHPVRVAEEWSVVDNLSDGRVGLSFAAGWNDNDFALAPGHFADRRERMIQGIETVRALWRGEVITLPSGTGAEVGISLHPRPVQPELPVWLTAAGNPDTFAAAGRLGANLLTHLLGQSPADLKAKVALYREAWRSHGHEGSGHVTLMLHTYVGKNQREARETVGEPLRRYLRSSTELVGRLAGAAGVSSDLTPAIMDRIVEQAFGRYYEESGLLGPIEGCLHTIDKLHDLDVDEVGCLIDFGVPEASALEGLERLVELREAAYAPRTSVPDYSLGSQIARYGVTHLQCTPSHASALLLDQRSVDAMRALQGVLLGGERLPAALARTLSAELPKATFYNMYGPTETTIWSSTYEVDATEEVIPIGRPVANTELHVLDSSLRPVPPGSVGDLYIGGLGLARGYRERPGLTAVRFLPDPFSAVPGRRMYASGDRARRRSDGLVEVLGRVDDQVKIRGHRVEPGEVEAALRLHPSVHEAAVVARLREGLYELAAFWVGKGSDTDEQQLRSFLRERLPEHLVPSGFFALDALPTTPNGKFDRAALAVPDDRRSVRSQVVEARDPLELELVGMWEAALDVRPVGVTDNFFELGGHSFTALRLMARLQHRFGKDSVSIATLLQWPTIEGVANLLRERVEETAVSQLVSKPDERYEPFRLTDLQHAYWLGEREYFDLGKITAHAYEELDFPTLDIARFQGALDKLIERHDGLRTIVVEGGQQRVLENVPAYPLKLVDLSDADAETVGARQMEERARMVAHGPATDVWPPFEFCVHRHSGGAARLHLSMSLMFMDGLSTTVLVRELLMFYTDPALVLPPLEATFRDYTQALAALEQDESYERAVEYWRARVPLLPPCPELPLMRPPSSMERQEMTRRAARLDPTTWGSLKKHAAAAALTPNAVLCAAYAAVLSCWSKEPHFTLNLLMGDRSRLHPEIDEVLGNFSATLLLEVAPAQRDESFESWATRVQTQLWNDLEHRAFSGLRVLGELNRTRGQLGRAGMPVVFASTLGLDPDQGALPENGTRTGYGSLQTPQVWIDLNLFERGGELLFNWDVAEKLFPAGMIDAMFTAYCELIDRLANEEAIWSQPLDMVAPRVVLDGFSEANQATEAVSDLLLHELFEAQACTRPEAIAVVAPTRTLAYGDLARRARVVASELQTQGAAPGEVVAVVMEKGWEQVVAVLGVLFAGCAYLPIDPKVPRERMEHLFGASKARCAVTQSWLSALYLPEEVARVVVADRVVTSAPQVAARHASPEDLAYVIYTSGSTGKPKGVMIDHRGAVNTILDINRRFEIGPEDRVLALSALSFDLSVWDIFGMLAAGGAVVFPGEEELRDPARWVDRLHEGQVTVWNTVPALMTLLVDYLDRRPERAPEHLRIALLSGDWIPLALPERVKERLPNVSLVSLGGATEASIWSIAFPIESVEPTWSSIPYGKPLANQGWQVLDRFKQPRPVWAVGDLYITGVGVAKGYFGDEARTQASFDEDPATGARRYRTGDVGRYLPDGNIELLGRSDLQVKIQGYRVELGEVEAALNLHHGVQASAVIAVGEKLEAKRLVAFVVPTSEPVATDRLRDHLRAKLPEYLVPTSFSTLEALPLSVNGKIDRASLAKLATSTPSSHRYEAARDGLERRLVDIWQEVLGQPSVGIRDNFFDLGGQSVVAVSLMAQVEQAFGRRLPLTALLEAPTIAEFAKLFRQAEASRAQRPVVTIQQRDEGPTLFLVHPVGGNVLCYAPLARSLDHGSVYALESPGLDGAVAPRGTIESMAADYVRAIRGVQGSGPYLLGGWSLGGVVAYEMARQLRAEGAEAALVVMFDSSTPQHDASKEPQDDEQLAVQFLSDLAQSLGKSISISASSLRALNASARLERLFELASAAGLVAEDSGRDRFGNLYEVFRSNMLALRRYVPGPYDGRVVLARAADVPGRDMDLGWSAVGAADLTVRALPGNHYTMMDPSNVATLATLVREFMRLDAAVRPTERRAAVPNEVPAE